MGLRDLLSSRRDPLESMRALVEPLERRFGRGPELVVDEKPKEIVIKAKLPGLKKEDIEVELTESGLTVRAQRAAKKESRRHGRYRSEESFVSFVRHIGLPTGIQTERASASFRDGLLEVHLPREKEATVSRINIE